MQQRTRAATAAPTPKEQADQQELRTKARPDLSHYAANWDAQSAAEELRLDRIAQAYEAGLLRPRHG